MFPVWAGPVFPAAVVLALLLPFAAIRPVLVTPWFSVTEDKAALLVAALAWLAQGARSVPEPREWRALAPSLSLLVVAAAASLLAPGFGDESLKSVWRLVAAAFALLLVMRAARAHDQVATVLWALTIGAAASALLGLAEATGRPEVKPLLALFKVAPTRVGADLRVSASFQYATIASMYFEMVAPLALVLAATTSRRWLQLLGAAIAVLCTLEVVLSLTRAGILTLGLTYAMLLALAWLGPVQATHRMVAPTSAAAAALLAAVAILTVRDPVFAMRLISESDAEWYAAAYVAPAALQLDPDRPSVLGVDVRNDGSIVWSASANNALHPFVLGYRWLTADASGELDLPRGEVFLAHDVQPGETIHLEARVDASRLPPGSYRLDWGMLQRDVVQFYERGSADAESLVTVGEPAHGSAAPLPTISPRDDGQAPWVVGRLQLWAAASRLIEARPLMGWGPDNFRHLYGAQLGLETWDERVQANNVYLELLVDTGILGLAAFVWVIAAPLEAARRALRAPVDASTACWLVGCCLGVIAFLVHGLLDSFLAFTPTALLLWLVLGMILNLSQVTPVARAQKPHVSGR